MSVAIVCSRNIGVLIKTLSFFHVSTYIPIAEDVRGVAWQQRNKASMTSDKRMVGTSVVLLHVSVWEYGKQR